MEEFLRFFVVTRLYLDRRTQDVRLPIATLNSTSMHGRQNQRFQNDLHAFVPDTAFEICPSGFTLF